MSQNESVLILQNENENVRMEMVSFQNENEMSSAGRGPQNDFRKMNPDSFQNEKMKTPK